MAFNILGRVAGPILGTVTAFLSSYHFKHWNGIDIYRKVDPYTERTRHLATYFDGGCQKHVEGFLCPITKRSIENLLIWQSAAGIIDWKRLQEAQLAFLLGQDCSAWFDKDSFVVRIIHNSRVLSIDAPPNTMVRGKSELFWLLRECVHFSTGCAKAVLPSIWVIKKRPHPAARAIMIGLRALLSALIFEYVGYYVYWPAGFTKAIAKTASHVVNRHRQSYRPTRPTRDLGTFIHFLAAKEGLRLRALLRVARRPVAALWVIRFGTDTFQSVLYASFMTEVSCATGTVLMFYFMLEIDGALLWLSSRPARKEKASDPLARVEIMDNGFGEQAFRLASALPQYSNRVSTTKHADYIPTSA